MKFQKTSFPDGIPECGKSCPFSAKIAINLYLTTYLTRADDLRFSLSYTAGGKTFLAILRMCYHSYPGGGDIIKVMHGYRKLCNKIYQATKYVLGKIDSCQRHPTKTGHESLAELWILHKFNTAATEINIALTKREFSQATKITYEYWYIQPSLRRLHRKFQIHHPRRDTSGAGIRQTDSRHSARRRPHNDPPLHALPDRRALAALTAASRRYLPFCRISCISTTQQRIPRFI